MLLLHGVAFALFITSASLCRFSLSLLSLPARTVRFNHFFTLVSLSCISLLSYIECFLLVSACSLDARNVSPPISMLIIFFSALCVPTQLKWTWEGGNNIMLVFHNLWPNGDVEQDYYIDETQAGRAGIQNNISYRQATEKQTRSSE